MQQSSGFQQVVYSVEMAAAGIGPRTSVYALTRSQHLAAQAALTVRRVTTHFTGREREVGDTLNSLQQHRAAILWGGLGEGKTAIAAEAACRLQGSGSLDLCAIISMQGVLLSV